MYPLASKIEDQRNIILHMTYQAACPNAPNAQKIISKYYQDKAKSLRRKAQNYQYQYFFEVVRKVKYHHNDRNTFMLKSV